MVSLTCGDTFTSYADFEKRLHEYQNQEKVLFIKGNGRKIVCENEEFRSRFVYDFVVFVCKQGKRTHQSDSKGIRPNQRSFKKGCEARIKIITKKVDGNIVLCVTVANLQHSNHPVNALTFSVYPENRRTGIMKDDAVTAMIKANTGTEELKRFIFKRHGTLVLSRDIQNLRRKILHNKTKPSGESDLEDVLKDIDTGGGLSQLSFHEDGNVKLLIFLTKQMRDDLNQFPNILIIDLAQGVNSLGYPLLSILCLDSNGCCRPVLHALLSQESSDSLSVCLKVLKECCTDCGRIFFVNKDSVDVTLVEEIFPGKIIKALIFHAVPCVKKALHKHSLPSQKVNIIANLFKDQRDTQSHERYAQLLQEISMSVPQETIRYFTTTWWNCSELWASHKAHGIEKLQMNVTRKIESYQIKIKTGKNRLSTAGQLGRCVKALIAKDIEIAMSRDTETLYSSIQSSYDTRNILDSIVSQVTNHLTSFSSELVIEQLELRERTMYDIFIVDGSEEYIMTDNILPDNQYTVKTDQCSCDFCTCIQLPCHHIFALRQYLQLPVYVKTLSKFGKPFYETEENNQGVSVLMIPKVELEDTTEETQEESKVINDTHEISRSLEENHESMPSDNGELIENEIVWPSETIQKPSKIGNIQDGPLRHLSSVTSQINTCLSKMEPNFFYKYLYQLEKFLKLIKDDKPLLIIDTSEADIDQQHRYVASETSSSVNSDMTTCPHKLLSIFTPSHDITGSVQVQSALYEKESKLVPVSNIQTTSFITTVAPVVHVNSSSPCPNSIVRMAVSDPTSPSASSVKQSITASDPRSVLITAESENRIASSEPMKSMSLLNSQSLRTNQVLTVIPRVKISSSTSLNTSSNFPSRSSEGNERQHATYLGRIGNDTTQKLITSTPISSDSQATSLPTFSLSSHRKRLAKKKHVSISAKKACASTETKD